MTLEHNLPSLHILAEMHQQFVAGFEADQTGSRVLNVKDDVYDDDGDDRESQDMQPTPVLAACHPITSQQGAYETQAKQ